MTPFELLQQIKGAQDVLDDTADLLNKVSDYLIIRGDEPDPGEMLEKRKSARESITKAARDLDVMLMDWDMTKEGS